MMKKMLRGKKGISLITLSITVVVLLILTSGIIYNLQDNLGLERLRNMQNDIENLRAKVDLYYAQYGSIPKIGAEYTNTENIRDLRSVNDTGNFYVIDLSALENLTLTYGEGYRNIGAELDVNNLEDIYIINEASHNIFYVKGVNVDGITYYTDYTKEDVDSKKIEIRYVDNIKIPEGLVYESGTSDDDLVVVLKNGDLTYNWISIEEKITIDTCPTATNRNDLSTEDLVDSINRYKGYYYCEVPGTTTGFIKYIEINDNWSPAYDIEAKYTDKNGDIAYIPEGFQVSRVPGSDNIKEGLVAKNAVTDNRYVWIEVPKSIFKTVTSNEDYTNIEEDIYDYVKDYATDDYFYDIWDSNNCAIQEEEDYYILKNEMLKSVYENGGFWISQYEIGTNEVRTSTSSITNKKAYSREGKYPFNYVTCTEAQTISTTIESDIGERQTSLMFGIQWKLIMKSIEDKGEKTQSELKTDSSSWGNYSNTAFSIYKGEYSTDNGQAYIIPSPYPYSKSATSNTLITTGTTIRNRVLNIYDLAGNVGEWTLERGYNSHSVYGGSYIDSSSASTHIAGTGIYDGTQYSENYVGFRVSLY